MTQEGIPGFTRHLAEIAEDLAQAARLHRDLARVYTSMGDSVGVLRARMAEQEEPRPYLADDQELKDAVLPEHRQQPPATPPAEPEGPAPWPTFLEGLGLAPVEAVELIRQELPDALRPATPEERADWPMELTTGTRQQITASRLNERQRAAVKLTGLTGDAAVRAQQMIRQLAGRRRAAR